MGPGGTRAPVWEWRCSTGTGLKRGRKEQQRPDQNFSFNETEFHRKMRLPRSCVRSLKIWVFLEAVVGSGPQIGSLLLMKGNSLCQGGPLDKCCSGKVTYKVYFCSKVLGPEKRNMGTPHWAVTSNSCTTAANTADGIALLAFHLNPTLESHSRTPLQCYCFRRGTSKVQDREQQEISQHLFVLLWVFPCLCWRTHTPSAVVSIPVVSILGS